MGRWGRNVNKNYYLSCTLNATNVLSHIFVAKSFLVDYPVRPHQCFEFEVNDSLQLFQLLLLRYCYSHSFTHVLIDIDMLSSAFVIRVQQRSILPCPPATERSVTLFAAYGLRHKWYFHHVDTVFSVTRKISLSVALWINNYIPRLLFIIYLAANLRMPRIRL